MTGLEFLNILRMVLMILDGCKDLEDAKGKIQKLIDEHTKPDKE